MDLKTEIRRLAKEKNAVIMAHYYVPDEVQDVADVLGDSLALAQKAAASDAKIIVLCGVHFMGETAAILCPDKKVLVPDLTASCSLAESCKAEDLKKFRDEHPNHTIISYVNTTAEVKAQTDIVVTSSNARKIVENLPQNELILFGPDANLGSYINKVTGRNMELWNGACHVHSRFKAEDIVSLKKEYPAAKVLVHPECNKSVVDLADEAGSTAALLKYATLSDADTFIVATENGILHEMQKAAPQKKFISAAQNRCDSTCEYMKMITLQKLYDCLKNETPVIKVDAEIAREAIKPIQRMLNS